MQYSDEYLRQMAFRRAKFKRHLRIYLLINAFLWVVFWFSTYPSFSKIPAEARIWVVWPVYSMLGWGVGLLAHYLGVYGGWGERLEEREYQKLLRERHEG